jgi:hypothetical protein
MFRNFRRYGSQSYQVAPTATETLNPQAESADVPFMITWPMPMPAQG